MQGDDLIGTMGTSSHASASSLIIVCPKLSDVRNVSKFPKCLRVVGFSKTLCSLGFGSWMSVPSNGGLVPFPKPPTSRCFPDGSVPGGLPVPTLSSKSRTFPLSSAYEFPTQSLLHFVSRIITLDTEYLRLHLSVYTGCFSVH
jgi:hypothetical protein